jgi:hypothetical protein
MRSIGESCNGTLDLSWVPYVDRLQANSGLGAQSLSARAGRRVGPAKRWRDMSATPNRQGPSVVHTRFKLEFLPVRFCAQSQKTLDQREIDL